MIEGLKQLIFRDFTGKLKQIIPLCLIYVVICIIAANFFVEFLIEFVLGIVIGSAVMVVNLCLMAYWFKKFFVEKKALSAMLIGTLRWVCYMLFAIVCVRFGITCLLGYGFGILGIIPSVIAAWIMENMYR